MKMIFLLILGLTALMADFVKKGETVHDSDTKLIWQDNAAVEGKEMIYSEANSYCKKLSLAGSDAWRLPTVQELQSIADLTRYDPAVKRGFHFAASESYWSSTLYADDADRAWDVNFKSGSTEHNRHSYAYNVRCVQDGQ